MITQVKLGEISVDVLRKDIKNIHLSIYPPTGRVRISAPWRIGLNTIRIFAISKLGWIKKQQRKLREQERETPREYLDRESHEVWGRRYLLKLIDGADRPGVELAHDKMILRVRPGTSRKMRRAIVDDWYRQQVKTAIPPLIARWEPVLGVKVTRFFVRKMKTKWGSCNPVALSIRLNTDLAKKPPECIEYIVVHEMVHLLERRHNERFKSLLDKYIPKWRFYRDVLNRLPVRHEDWRY